MWSVECGVFFIFFLKIAVNHRPWMNADKGMSRSRSNCEEALGASDGGQSRITHEKKVCFFGSNSEKKQWSSETEGRRVLPVGVTEGSSRHSFIHPLSVSACVPQVKLIDNFTNKKGMTSHCYRINYRSMERSLTNEEVDSVQVRHENPHHVPPHCHRASFPLLGFLCIESL